MEGHSGEIKRDNHIDTIDSWGPYFKLALDLMINSKVYSSWSNILAFRGKLNEYDDNTLAIFYNSNGHLHFINSVSGNSNYSVEKRVDLNRWYHIEIEQKRKDGKVLYIINTNGEQVHSVENTYVKSFRNVKVFAGDKNHPSADGTYRNFIWDNIGKYSNRLSDDTKVQNKFLQVNLE